MSDYVELKFERVPTELHMALRSLAKARGLTLRDLVLGEWKKLTEAR